VWQPTIVPPELSSWVLTPLLAALTEINRAARRNGYSVPPLYRSGVRYREEPHGSERWLSSVAALREGSADCEDLACWLAADLLDQGLPARAIPLPSPQRTAGGGRLYHIVVDRGSGLLEDPSRNLGM